MATHGHDHISASSEANIKNLQNAFALIIPARSKDWKKLGRIK
jgi:hypothetical protein